MIDRIHSLSSFWVHYTFLVLVTGAFSGQSCPISTDQDNILRDKNFQIDCDLPIYDDESLFYEEYKPLTGKSEKDLDLISKATFMMLSSNNFSADNNSFFEPNQEDVLINNNSESAISLLTSFMEMSVSNQSRIVAMMEWDCTENLYLNETNNKKLVDLIRFQIYASVAYTITKNYLA